MCVPLMAAAMVATAVSASASAYGQYRQGQASAGIARNNATMAGYAAQDAQYQGEMRAQAAQRQAAQVQGATRARLAANGVDLGVGTAADLQAQNDFFGEQNASNARYDAARQAWSDRAQQSNFTFQSHEDVMNGNLGAAGTAIGGAGQVAGKWYGYTNPSPVPGTGGLF